MVEWKPIECAPEGEEVLVYRCDEKHPWAMGFTTIAWFSENGFGEKEWRDAADEAISDPVLWAPIPRPEAPTGWTPKR